MDSSYILFKYILHWKLIALNTYFRTRKIVQEVRDNLCACTQAPLISNGGHPAAFQHGKREIQTQISYVSSVYQVCVVGFYDLRLWGHSRLQMLEITFPHVSCNKQTLITSLLNPSLCLLCIIIGYWRIG